MIRSMLNERLLQPSVTIEEHSSRSGSPQHVFRNLNFAC